MKRERPSIKLNPISVSGRNDESLTSDTHTVKSIILMFNLYFIMSVTITF